MRKIALALPFLILASPSFAQSYNDNSQGEGSYYSGGSRGYENSQGAATYYYGGGNGAEQRNSSTDALGNWGQWNKQGDER